ncbi:MAG TPA: hypothetical protein VNA66_09880 [Gammaproteobacteria bacterium]|jgi:hypothetical protein|nr:hypothetical protein [Gammaproteobacteria bacterium]
MHFGRTWCVIVGLTAVAGCSRNETLPCQPEARYSTARSAPPVQIPDDLSPPDESDAIRLPGDVVAAGSITAGECLENPPPFSGDSRPFLTTEESEGQSRKQRREAKRAERAEASAAQPAAAPASQPEAAPPKQPDPSPANDDRVIDN